MTDEDIDLKIDEAAREIEAICAKYNLVGAITIVSPNKSRFMVTLTSWSGIKFKKEKNRMRIAYGVPDNGKNTVENSAHVAYAVAERAKDTLEAFRKVVESLEVDLGIKSKDDSPPLQ